MISKDRHQAEHPQRRGRGGAGICHPGLSLGCSTGTVTRLSPSWPLLRPGQAVASKSTSSSNMKKTSSRIHCSVCVATSSHQAAGTPGLCQLIWPALQSFDTTQPRLTIPGFCNSVRGLREIASNQPTNSGQLFYRERRLIYLFF